jgi:hypothetical protein
VHCSARLRVTICSYTLRSTPVLETHATDPFLFHSQTFEDAMAECPDAKRWYKRMEHEVGGASRSDGVEN